MHDFKQYSQQLKQLSQQLDAAKHRQLVLITGEAQWCYQLIKQCTTPSSAAILSTHSECEAAFWPQHIHQLLGQEFQHAVYDGYSGLYPSMLAALAGTVKAGGLLFLLLPELKQLEHWLDPALASVQSYGCHSDISYFNQRLAQLLSQHALLHISEADGITSKIAPQHGIHEIDFAPQQACIAQIVKTAKGRAQRPLLINADRGRGKSAALGLSAAQLSDKRIMLCATQFKACHSSFKHLAQALNIPYCSEQKELANVRYIAPDVLLSSLPQCDVLFVDEAAAIPVPMLLKMLQHYPRIVFASTLVGYEGNGRGYTLRFSKYVQTQYKAAKVITLDEPLRFAKHDPLEQQIRSLFALDAQYQTCEISQHTLNYALVSQQQLAQDEALLQQIISLLALAHYQSSVNDLRQLLDAPSQRLFICQHHKHIVGVCLVAIEGGFTEAMASQVITGKRRPQGHLMAQTLAQLSANPQFLTHKSARIVRIAIAPNLHQQGLGSSLISYCQQQLKHDCLCIGASFGANAELINFWQANQFQLVKLGFTADKATAEHAALVVKSFDNNNIDLNRAIAYFQSDFPLQLLDHFSQLDDRLVACIVQAFSSQPVDRQLQLRLTQALQGNAQLHTIKPIVWRAFWHDPQSLKKCDENTQSLIIRLVLKNEPLVHTQSALNISGKKALQQQIKKAIGVWHEYYCSQRLH